MPNFDIENFLSFFLKAIDNVGSEYYSIKTTYDTDGIVRERVFCYELYHQFRTLTGDDYPYAFHGELDKRGHSEIYRLHQKTPDFLIHKPGSMEYNKVIIEVKGIIRNRDVIVDIKKIHSYLTKVKYKYGVFLLFNHSFEDLQENISSTSLDDIDSQKDEDIYVICKSLDHGNTILHKLGELRKG